MWFTSIFQSKIRFALAAALACCGLAALATPATAASCPQPLFLESTNGKFYVAVFTAPVVMRSSIDITLYSKSNAYAASLSQLSIEKPWSVSSDVHGFRSYTVLLANPGTDPLLAATVRPFGFSDDTVCPPENRFIPSVAEVTSPPRPLTPEETALQNQIAAEAGDGSNAFAVTPVPPPPTLGCAAPYQPAALIKAVAPNVAAPGAGQNAAVAVDINERGAVTGATITRSSGDRDFDRALLAAARASTYSAPVFACIAQPGRYLFAASAR
jgi:TonB family protein